MAGEGVNTCDAQISVSIDAQGRSVRGIVAYQQTKQAALPGASHLTQAPHWNQRRQMPLKPLTHPQQRKLNAGARRAGILLVQNLAVRILGQEFASEIISSAAERQLNN